MADISKITLPSGTTYDIKDTVARQMATGVMKIIGKTTTALTDGSTTNPITLITDPTTNPPTTTEYTAVNGDTVISGSKEFTWVTKEGTTAHWVEFGDLTGLGNMAYVDQGTVTIKPKGTNAASAVTFTGGTTDKVLGEATTFALSAAPTITWGEHTRATVLKSDVTATVPKASGTPKYMAASLATNVAVGVATSASAITGLGDASTDTFVKSYPGATSKLVTSSVTGVQSSTTTASKATAGTAVAVATVDTAKTVATGSLGTETSTRTANTPMWGATVTNETLSFTFKPISTTSVTPAKSNGTITPYTFADVTVPIKATSATTVATGALSTSGGGSSVMTGLGTATTASAVTGYADPTTDTFAKTVSVTTQPVIKLTAESSTATNRAAFISAITESGTNAVTFNLTDHTADAITALGTATVSKPSITVGTNDKVTAVTGIGTGTAAAQTFTGTQETYTVNPKTT